MLCVHVLFFFYVLLNISSFCFVSSFGDLCLSTFVSLACPRLSWLLGPRPRMNRIKMALKGQDFQVGEVGYNTWLPQNSLPFFVLFFFCFFVLAFLGVTCFFVPTKEANRIYIFCRGPNSSLGLSHGFFAPERAKLAIG